MKTIKFIILLFVSLFLKQSVMAQAPRQLTIPLSNPGKPYTLNVTLISGNIDVTGYDGKDIVIDISAEDAKPKPTTDAGGMRMISGGSSAIVANEKDNKVFVDGNTVARGSNLKIKVPRGTTNTFNLTTVNSRGITASDISGQIEVSNTNGSIKLSGVSGSVVANTTNGDVIVTFKSVDAKAAMAFSTLNGRVDVTLPVAVKANIKLHTDKGNIFSDFDVTTEASSPTTTRGKDGSYSYTDQEWTTGKLGGGGPEFMMRTFNGNIYIRKAK